MKITAFTFLSFQILIFAACSASTGSRYEKKEVKVEEKPTEKDEEVNEDFDITPYQTDIQLESETVFAGQIPDDVWYGYEEKTGKDTKNIVGTTDGYRVQVLATDNIEEANETRSLIYSKTTDKEVYVSFEPPFYKVKVGDFTSNSDANDLKFMLNQLGYKEARVVRETINLFEK